MTLHLVGLPHTRLDDRYPTCPHTAKVGKMRRMDLGRPLIVYGGPGSDIELIDDETRLSMFGPDDPNRLPRWPDDANWAAFNARAVGEIAQRAEATDLLLLAGGQSQRFVQDALQPLLAVEPGFGYEAAVTAPCCAFESAAWMHYIYGRQGINDGRRYDTVIPLAADPDEFPHLNGGQGEYVLFLGRVTLRKGPHVAAEIARQAGMKLLIAGPGVATVKPGVIVADHVVIEGDHVEYVGTVDAAARAELLAGARALLAPTLYIEPFGGVAVEAMMAGTPVVASDWGGFTETVEPGITGARFRTVADAVQALDAIDDLDAYAIRERAIERFSLDAIAPMFRDWFDQLQPVHHLTAA